jgi:hypothetical protein
METNENEGTQQEMPTEPQPATYQDRWQDAKAKWTQAAAAWPFSRAATVGVAVALLMVCVVCACCGQFMTSFHDLGGKTSAQSQPTQAQSAKATAKPTQAPKAAATPDLFTPYKNIVVADTTLLVMAMQDASDSCGAEDLPGCRRDAQTVNETVHAFQSDLDKHPAPPCLKDADKHLRAALKLLDSGSQKAVDGIDDFDADEMGDGARDLNAGTDELTAATDAMKNAKC